MKFRSLSDITHDMVDAHVAYHRAQIRGDRRYEDAAYARMVELQNELNGRTRSIAIEREIIDREALAASGS